MRWSKTKAGRNKARPLPPPPTIQDSAKYAIIIQLVLDGAWTMEQVYAFLPPTVPGQ